MKILLSIIAILIIPKFCLGINYEIGDTLKVTSKPGLNLRESPNTNAKKIKLLKFGSNCIVSNTFNFQIEKRDTIEGRIGNWILVQSNQKEGYVFDGYCLCHLCNTSLLAHDLRSVFNRMYKKLLLCPDRH